MAKTRQKAREKLAQAVMHTEKVQEIAHWFATVYDEYAEFGGIGVVVREQMTLTLELLHKMQNKI